MSKPNQTSRGKQEVAKKIVNIPDFFGEDTSWKFGDKVQFLRLVDGKVSGYTYERGNNRLHALVLIISNDDGLWSVKASQVEKLR